MKFKLSELELVSISKDTCFGPNTKYKVIKIKTGGVLFEGNSPNEIENYLRSNVELSADKVLATKSLSEAVARAFSNFPRPK